MSDGKEVKRYIPDNTPIYLVGESTPEPTTCVVFGRDHDRIVAAKDAAYDALDNVNMKLNEQVAELRAEVERLSNGGFVPHVNTPETKQAIDKLVDDIENVGRLRETIARQARVIENLNKLIVRAVHSWGDYAPEENTKAHQTWFDMKCHVIEIGRAAIERAEGEKE